MKCQAAGPQFGVEMVSSGWRDIIQEEVFEQGRIWLNGACSWEHRACSSRRGIIPAAINQELAEAGRPPWVFPLITRKPPSMPCAFSVTKWVQKVRDRNAARLLVCVQAFNSRSS